MDPIKDLFRDHDDTTPEFSLNGIETYGRLVSVYDADTLTVVIPLENHFFKFSMRVDGIDSPEMKASNKEAKILARKARDRMVELCTGEHLRPSVNDTDERTKKKWIKDYLKKNVCLVYVRCKESDKYGRPLVDVSKDVDSDFFSKFLLQEKLVYEYHGATKLSEESQVAALAEEE
jgi:endonuclease YncB( thermonuclease family)